MFQPRRHRPVASLFLLVLVGCSDEVVVNPTPALESVAGRYVGRFGASYSDAARFGPGAWGAEVSFDAAVVLDVEQTGSSLSGTWTLEGMEDWGGGIPVGPVSLTGVFDGQVGPESSIEITFATCDTQERFYGVVANNGRLMRLWGRFPLTDSNCHISFVTPTNLFALALED